MSSKEPVSLNEIMNEEQAKHLQKQEYSNIIDTYDDIPEEILLESLLLSQQQNKQQIEENDRIMAFQLQQQEEQLFGNNYTQFEEEKPKYESSYHKTQYTKVQVPKKPKYVFVDYDETPNTQEPINNTKKLKKNEKTENQTQTDTTTNKNNEQNDIQRKPKRKRKRKNKKKLNNNMNYENKSHNKIKEEISVPTKHDPKEWSKKHHERLKDYEVMGELDENIHVSNSAFNSIRNTLDKKGYAKHQSLQFSNKKR